MNRDLEDPIHSCFRLSVFSEIGAKQTKWFQRSLNESKWIQNSDHGTLRWLTFLKVLSYNETCNTWKLESH